MIDRKGAGAVAVLVRLAGSRARLEPATAGGGSSPSQGASFDAVQNGLPPPDASMVEVDGSTALAGWNPQRVALLSDGVNPMPWTERGLRVVRWPDQASGHADAISALKDLLQ